MTVNRGMGRPSPAPGATRSNVSAPSVGSAGVARQASSGLLGPLNRAAKDEDINPDTKKPGKADEGLSNDDAENAAGEVMVLPKKDDDGKTKKADDKVKIDGNSPDTKPSNDDDKDKVKKSAGDGGDFKPLKGNATDPWDANSDKGNTPAKNSTGAPDTPSGL